MKLQQALHCLAPAVWVTVSTASHAQPNTAASPPAAPPQRTAAELEKLLAPIALMVQSLRAKAPAGKEANWTQTVPGKGWLVLFRLYGPLEPWFNRTWRPGEFELVK